MLLATTNRIRLGPCFAEKSLPTPTRKNLNYRSMLWVQTQHYLICLARYLSFLSEFSISHENLTILLAFPLIFSKPLIFYLIARLNPNTERSSTNHAWRISSLVMAKFKLRQRRRLSPSKCSQPPTNGSWEEFVKWCQSKGLNPVPANPWTVAAYARSMEGKYKPGSIRKHIGELARIHTAKTRKRLAHHPMVQRTLEIIERRDEVDKSSSELFTDDDFLSSVNTRTSKLPKPINKKTPPKKSSKGSWPGLTGQPRLVSRRSLKR